MVPSSPKDVTPAVRGQPKRLSRNYLIVDVLISFHSRDVFSALSRLFIGPDFRLFCARLAVHYLAVYSVLRSLIKQTLPAMTTSAMAVKACHRPSKKKHMFLVRIFIKIRAGGRFFCYVLFPIACFLYTLLPALGIRWSF